MKNVLKTLGCVAIIITATLAKGAAATPELPPRQATYDCTTMWHDTFTRFELFLQAHSYPAGADPVQFAKITADDGSIFRGKFGFEIIDDGTRLSGFKRYYITAMGDLGTVALSLVDSGPLWGSGVVNIDGTEASILVDCKKL